MHSTDNVVNLHVRAVWF